MNMREGAEYSVAEEPATSDEPRNPTGTLDSKAAKGGTFSHWKAKIKRSVVKGTLRRHSECSEPIKPGSQNCLSEQTDEYAIPSEAASDSKHENHIDIVAGPSVEKYTKKKKIGSGTYANVYVAIASDGRKVALKELKMNNEEGFPSTSMREISILRELNHENVVKLIDVLNEKGSATLVFEYVERDLRKIISGNVALRADKVREYSRQIFRGLEYCHRKKIIHRDLKPENILITNDDVLKIADFGLARQTTIKTNNLGSDVVTLWYRPPEILLGETTYDGKIDIWSVGCILFEMITRMPLFPGKDVDSQIRRIFDSLGFPPLDYWPNLANDATLQRLYPADSRYRGRDGLIKEGYASGHLLGRLNNLSGGMYTYPGLKLAFPLMVKCLQPNKSVRIDAAMALADEYFLSSGKKEQEATDYFNFSKEENSGATYSVPQATEYVNTKRAISRKVSNPVLPIIIQPSNRTSSILTPSNGLVMHEARPMGKYTEPCFPKKQLLPPRAYSPASPSTMKKNAQETPSNGLVMHETRPMGKYTEPCFPKKRLLPPRAYSLASPSTMEKNVQETAACQTARSVSKNSAADSGYCASLFTASDFVPKEQMPATSNPTAPPYAKGQKEKHANSRRHKTLSRMWRSTEVLSRRGFRI
ncbi:Cyclin-dependent kinase 16 [Sparganum proliferum]